MTTFRSACRWLATVAVLLFACGGLALSPGAALADAGSSFSTDGKFGGGKVAPLGRADSLDSGIGAGQPPRRHLRRGAGGGKRTLRFGDIHTSDDGRRAERERSLRWLGGVGLVAAMLLAARRSGRDNRHLPAVPRPSLAWLPLPSARSAIERAVHLVAMTSGMLLALSGLLSFYGRSWLPSLFGQAAFDATARLAMELHGLAASAFFAALAVALAVSVRRAMSGWGEARRRRGKVAPASMRLRAMASTDGARRAVAWMLALAAAVLVATGLSLTLPFGVRLFAGAHDLLVAIGLAEPPGVTLWRDMQVTGLAHVVAALVLVALSVVQVALGAGAARTGEVVASRTGDDGNAAAAPGRSAPKLGALG